MVGEDPKPCGTGHLVPVAVRSVGLVVETRCPSLSPWAVSAETLQSEAKPPSACGGTPRGVRSSNKMSNNSSEVDAAS